MNKELFKITKKKIFVTTIILILFAVNVYTGFFGGPHLNLILLLPIVFFLILTIYIKGLLAFIIVMFSLVVEGVYLYFISCISVSFYNKYLRKSKK